MRPITAQNIQDNSEIESLLCRIQDVISARVISEGTKIVELHVLADAGRSPKQVVRDIESAVLLKTGLKLDHKCISIAQLGHEGKKIPSPGFRLKLNQINYSINDLEITVSTTICLGHEAYTASASGSNIKQNSLRLVVSTTLAAVEQYLGIDAGCAFTVEDTQKISIAGESAVAVCISSNLSPQKETLLGIAQIREDDLQSAARAALDAVNRRLMINFQA